MLYKMGKATIPTLAEKLTLELVIHIQVNIVIYRHMKIVWQTNVLYNVTVCYSAIFATLD